MRLNSHFVLSIFVETPLTFVQHFDGNQASDSGGRWGHPLISGLAVQSRYRG